MAWVRLVVDAHVVVVLVVPRMPTVAAVAAVIVIAMVVVVIVVVVLRVVATKLVVVVHAVQLVRAAALPQLLFPRVVLVPAAVLAAQRGRAVLLRIAAPPVGAAALGRPASRRGQLVRAELAAAAAVRADAHPDPHGVLVVLLPVLACAEEDDEGEHEAQEDGARAPREGILGAEHGIHAPLRVRIHGRGVGLLLGPICG
eukprot:CAMPEP_0206012868 /NCGR_PEP_ID=MMETSP1464-20131121/15539_1 /ASSEMBLY_ACC=CAM_ASM_001124 /TAXON_ID=119497 /ORGANISM="Exanthemachrysis gayraliae, Strain RCC1523" /LENGTH=199 /DNA_ID=CAMNT_0053386567 /DNA_START=548 /DNA_END=1144 /DNA_ORIENTATION=-